MINLKKAGVLISVIFFIAVMVVSTACGSSSASAQEEPGQEITEETAAAAETTTMAEPVQENTEETVIETASGDCPDSTNVSVESTNGAYEDRTPISWDSLGAQAAYISNTYGNTAVSIYIANFDTEENLKDVALSDGQAIIYFALRVRGEGDPVPISTGIYNMTDYDNNDLHVGANIRLSGGTTLTVSSNELIVSEFEITSVTDTEICGNFNIDEKWTKMSGEFNIPITK